MKSMENTPDKPAQTDVFDQFLQAFAIAPQSQTDPTILLQILSTTMYLADLPSLAQYLGPKLQQSQTLQPLITQIGLAIKEKHPAIQEFIQTILHKNLIPHLSESGSYSILWILHYIYLLQEITLGIAHNDNLNEEIKNHLLKKRKEFNIRESFWGSFIDIYRVVHNVFEPVKAKTMDKVYFFLKKMRFMERISRKTFFVRKNLISLNILEAVFTDIRQGYLKNARAGLSLIAHPLQNIAIEGPHKFVKQTFAKGWAELYETWNLAFVTGNMNNLHIIYPKLLIPCVLGASPENYLYFRTIALWLTVNFQLFAKIHNVNIRLPNARKYAKIWGDINDKYRSIYRKNF